MNLGNLGGRLRNVKMNVFPQMPRFGSRESALNRDLLIKIRQRSLRRGVLYRVLSRLERSILELTIRCVEVVRSQTLFRSLMTLISKLTDALKSRFLSRVEEVGRPIARRMSILAQSLGHKEASSWGEDPTYIRYLGVRALNTCKIYS